MEIMPKLATICIRAGLTEAIAESIWLAIKERRQIDNGVAWADQLGEYVIGQGLDHTFFSVFPCPFEGHTDDWQVIQPINNAKDLLTQLTLSEGSANAS